MVGPSHTTTPSRTGSPVPGISRSASIRSIHRLLAALARRAARVGAGLPSPRPEPSGRQVSWRSSGLPSSAHGSGPEDQFTLLEAAHGYADTVPLEGFREIHHLVSVPSLIRPERLGRATLAGSEMWATASIKRRVITVQPDELALRLKRVVQASPFTVFRACTVPEELAKWWGPRGFTTPAIEIDLRVGGRYRFALQPPERGAVRLPGG